MDRTGIIVVTLCVILLGAWFIREQKYYSQVAQSQTGSNTLATVQPPAFTTTSNAAPAGTTAGAAATTGFPVDTNVAEQTLVLTNAHERYTFTSRGGGLKSVELLDYPETISARWKQTTSNAGVATLNTRAPVPVLTILGEPSLIGDGNFTLIKTAAGVHAEKIFPNGLRIVKEFQVGEDDLMNVTVRMSNLSSRSLPLPTQEWVIGTATPMDVDDNTFPIYGGTMWFDGTSEEQISLSYFSTNTTILFVFPRTPKAEYRAGASNVVWAAAYNQFFTLLAMPKTTPAVQVIARPISLAPFPNVEPVPGMPLPEGIQTALVYPAETLGTNQVIERQMVLYAGAKGIPDARAHRQTISKSCRPGHEFWLGLHYVLGRGNLFCQGVVVVYELAARPDTRRLRPAHRLDYGAFAGDLLAVDGRQHPVDETDAGARAGTEGAAGKIQGRHAEAHPEAMGALPQTQGQPDERLPAHADPDAGILWFLYHAAQRD